MVLFIEQILNSASPNLLYLESRMTDVKAARKASIEELADLMFESQAMMEIYFQIEESSGKSPFDIDVKAPSGKKLPYASVHRWIGILRDHGAIAVCRREDSKKGGTKIIYCTTDIGREAYSLAHEAKKQHFLQEAESLRQKESRNVKGLRAPDLLKELMELWLKEGKTEGS
jgi:hypothetical protein